MDTKKPIIAIVGPTASGKSDLAMRLAQKFNGEIICADSRTIYKEMDIGTAKPSFEDRQKIRHHCLDMAAPNERYSAAEFKRHALLSLKEIHSRGHTPFLVGGSGLYIDGLLYDFNFSAESNSLVQARLEDMDLKDLQSEAKKLGIKPNEINFKNQRHLARAVERGGVFINKKPLEKNILILGIKISKSELEARIRNRIELMIKNGVENEARILLQKYGESAPGLSAPGYKALIEYISGACSLKEARNKFISNDKKLAKRQKTWFKKNQDIKWIKNYPEAEKYASDFLSKFDTIAG